MCPFVGRLLSLIPPHRFPQTPLIRRTKLQPQNVLRRSNKIYNENPRSEWRALQGRSRRATPSKRLASQVWSVLLSVKILYLSSSRPLHRRRHTLSPCKVSRQCWVSKNNGKHSYGAARPHARCRQLHVRRSRSDAEFPQHGECMLSSQYSLVFSRTCLLPPLCHVRSIWTSNQAGRRDFSLTATLPCLPWYRRCFPPAFTSPPPAL